MKQYKGQSGLISLMIWVLVFTGSQILVAQNIPSKPNPPKLVNDIAGILTPYQLSHLEERLVAYDDSTSVQIAVVIVPTLDGANVADYAIELGRQWGVGNKKTNNGVVVLMSVEEGKRKIFIAPGYGLEASLPDITAKSIIDNEMLPSFREGNYYRGLERGVDGIIQATMGEYTAPEGYGKRGKDGGGGIVFFLILGLVLLLLFLGNRGGGGGGDAMTRRGHRHMNTPPFIFFPPIGGGGGRGGGFGGFGGGGGGGFGGFGGGGFGGGGAGGSW